MSSPALVRLHPQRLLQLKALAEKDGLPVSEAIESLISREIRQYPELDYIPCFIVSESEGIVFIEMEKFYPLELSPVQAEKIASYIGKILEKPEERYGNIDIKKDYLLVGRRGRGIFIKATSSVNTRATSEITLSLSLASDLARQLEHAASAARTRSAVLA